MKTATAKVRSYNAKNGYASFQEKYYRVCIARAAVNENVCEDSHAEFAMVIILQNGIVHILCNT